MKKFYCLSDDSQNLFTDLLLKSILQIQAIWDKEWQKLVIKSGDYGKVIVFIDDFLVINLLINRKVTENYLLLLGSVYYNYLYLKILTVYYLLHAITLKISLLPITFLLPITYYSMSGTIHIDNIPAMQPNAEV